MIKIGKKTKTLSNWRGWMGNIWLKKSFCMSGASIEIKFNYSDRSLKRSEFQNESMLAFPEENCLIINE